MILVFSRYIDFKELIKKLTRSNKLIKYTLSTALAESAFGTFKWIGSIEQSKGYDLNNTKYIILNRENLDSEYLDKLDNLLYLRPFKKFESDLLKCEMEVL